MRFKEFLGSWQTVKIDDLVDIKYGKDYKHLSVGKYPVLGTGGIISYVEDYLYSGKSILIGRKGTIDKPKFIDGAFWTVDTLFYTIIKRSNPKFLFYQLENINWLKYNEASGVPSLSANNIKNIKIKIPTIEEQNKIADFLSKIDKKIELLEKTLVLYQKYGKSIKNNYFDNLETDTCTKFKEIIKKGKAGGTPKSTNKEFYGGKIPFLSINDMTKQGKYIKNTEKSITEKGLDNSSAWIVPKGSLLYSIYASIGFVSINTIDLSTSQAIYGIILKENINQDFIYHYLQDFKRHIHKYIETGTQGNLNSKIVQNLEIKLPSLKEQNYYSIFFNNLDYKTEVIQKSIDELREYKKGLLQKMFI